MYRFKVRPGYGSNDLLIEFDLISEHEEFLTVLVETLRGIDASPREQIDLWMNDEVLLEFDSNLGRFVLSSDIWGMVFLMDGENPSTIESIGSLLADSDRFEAEAVDPQDYR